MTLNFNFYNGNKNYSNLGEGRTRSCKNRIFGAHLILILREKTVIYILFECHRREHLNIEERRNGLAIKRNMIIQVILTN